MKRTFKILLIFSLLAFALTACDRREVNTKVNEQNIEEITANTETLLTSAEIESNGVQSLSDEFMRVFSESDGVCRILTLLDDGFVYATFAPLKEGQFALHGYPMTYYRYYFESDEIVEIGTIDNYQYVGGTLVMDNKLCDFLFATGLSEEDMKEDNGVNFVVEIDLDNNDFSYREFNLGDEDYLPNQTIRKYNNETIVVGCMTGEIEDASTTKSFLKTFDLKNNTTTAKTEEAVYDGITDTGIMLNGLSVHGDKIYAWRTDNIGEFWTPQSETFESPSILTVYDENLERLYDMDLSEIPDDFSLAGTFGMTFWDDYVHIYNYNRGCSIICEIEGEKLVPLITKERMNITLSDFDIENPVFYIPHSNEIFTFDKETKSIVEHKILPDEIKTELATMPDGSEKEIEIGFSIDHIFQNNGNIFVKTSYKNPTSDEVREPIFHYLPIPRS